MKHANFELFFVINNTPTIAFEERQMLHHRNNAKTERSNKCGITCTSNHIA